MGRGRPHLGRVFLHGIVWLSVGVAQAQVPGASQAPAASPAQPPSTPQAQAPARAQAEPPATAQKQSPSGAENDRGRYLVEQVALCVQCHTPRDASGNLDRSRWLQGATIPFTPNLRTEKWAYESPAISGLPAWSETDAVRLLETGIGPNGIPPRSPMPSYRLQPADAAAIVGYLKSLPPPRR